MASFFTDHLITLLFLFLLSVTSTTTTISASNSATFLPKALLLRVSKDPITSQYTATLIQRTPPMPVSLTLDLSNPFLWVVCGNRYTSTTYHPLPCGSRQCKLTTANTCKSCPAFPKPGCNKNTCRSLSITNPLTHATPPRGSELAADVVRINSTDGSTTGPPVTFPNFVFACAPVSFRHGLAKGVSGIAGLGRSKLSLPSQSSSTLHFAEKFALCLTENGAVFLGDGPYNYNPAGTGTVVDLRTKLSYTPLLPNPVFISEYFIQVQAIKVGEKNVPINKSLLSLNNKGYGGTTISLVHPYTVLETSIFEALTVEFDRQLRTCASEPCPKRVKPVAPFEFCYDRVPSFRTGPEVPVIRLVLQSEKVVWTIYGPNSVVSMGVGEGSPYCFGFVDGGKNPRTAIVIGGYQIEDNLLQFDLVKSRLGFSSTLIYDRIRCSFFNFTSHKTMV